MSETESTGDWYCKNCGYLDWQRVTYSENCDDCGEPVQWVEVDDRPLVEQLSDRIAELEQQLGDVINPPDNAFDDWLNSWFHPDAGKPFDYRDRWNTAMKALTAAAHKGVEG